MKLCAPRRSDARSVTELSACQLCQSTGGAGCEPDSAACAASGMQQIASMSGAILSTEADSIGHWLHRIDAAVKRHQHKEGEIRHAARAREHHVNALRRLQPDRKSTRLN